MPYSQINQQDLVAIIAAALGDSTNVFWSPEEIGSFINEGMYLWGAFTAYWRARGSFQTRANQPFYDLSDSSSTSVQLANLRPRTITLNQMVTEIQWMLMESPTGLAGTDQTGQFGFSNILQSIAYARNQFSLDTRLPYTFGLFPISSPPDGRFDLDQSISLISRAAWLDADGVYTPLTREDTYSAQASNYIWTLEPGVPTAYSVADTQPVQMQLIPAPSDSGQVQLVYVATETLDMANPLTTFNVPNEICMAIKYYALYLLLSADTVGNDPFRAQYCMERYKSIVEVAKKMNSAMLVQVGGVPAQLDTLASLDKSDLYWQTNTGKPSIAACVYDLLALSRVPDSVYGVSCDVVQAAPIPTSALAYIQMGKEEVEYLINYVKHILSFKLAGQELRDAMPMFDTFMAGASQRSRLLQKSARYLTPLFGQSKKEESYVPAV